jgi:hypothetical protein
MKKMTIGGEGERYLYLPITHKMVRVCQTPKPPCLKPGASAFARAENNSAWLAFYGWEYLRYVVCFEHLVPPIPLLVSPLLVRLVL